MNSFVIICWDSAEQLFCVDYFGRRRWVASQFGGECVIDGRIFRIGTGRIYATFNRA